jgi:hypothetical protein
MLGKPLPPFPDHAPEPPDQAWPVERWKCWWGYAPPFFIAPGQGFIWVQKGSLTKPEISGNLRFN